MFKSISLFILIALFLCYVMGLQVSPSVITHELMHDLHLNVVDLGWLSGIYFYTYTAMQIPAGLLFDRYSVRYVVLVPLLLCALGTYIFASAGSFALGAAARLLIGGGSAFAFVSVLVVVGDLFPEKYFALMAGITQLLAAIGAIAGEVPLLKLVNALGWRMSMLVLAGVGVILAALITLFVRYKKTYSESQQSLDSVWQSLRLIAKNPQTWFIAIYACLLWSPMAMFASLWGVPFLQEAFHLSHEHAADYMIFMWMGLGLGSPLIGWLSDKIGRRNLLLTVSAILGLGAVLFILYYTDMPFWALGLSLFIAGAATSGQLLSFAVVRENNLKSNRAAALSFNNMAVVISGAIFQPLVAKLMEWHWDGQIIHGIPAYLASDYRFGLILMPFVFAIGILISFFFIRETYCQGIKS